MNKMMNMKMEWWMSWIFIIPEKLRFFVISCVVFIWRKIPWQLYSSDKHSFNVSTIICTSSSSSTLTITLINCPFLWFFNIIKNINLTPKEINITKILNVKDTSLQLNMTIKVNYNSSKIINSNKNKKILNYRKMKKRWMTDKHQMIIVIMVQIVLQIIHFVKIILFFVKVKVNQIILKMIILNIMMKKIIKFVVMLLEFQV